MPAKWRRWFTAKISADANRTQIIDTLRILSHFRMTYGLPATFNRSRYADLTMAALKREATRLIF